MNKKEYRLIDANLNRAREGLRVIEDTARFVLDNAGLYRKTRALRHKLTEITGNIYPSLLASRDSDNDAGRVIREYKRKSAAGLVVANFRRVEEALRVLEEYSRLVSASAGTQFKVMRFRIYAIEKLLIKEAGKSNG